MLLSDFSRGARAVLNSCVSEVVSPSSKMQKQLQKQSPILTAGLAMSRLIAIVGAMVN